MAEKKEGKKFGGFPAGEEIKIELPPVERDGEVYKGLTHIFRQPSAAERLRYWRTASQAEIVADREGEPVKRRGGDYWRAVEELYDSLILRVDGYAFEGGTDGWVDKMPIEHKGWAIELLNHRLAGSLTLDFKKK